MTWYSMRRGRCPPSPRRSARPFVPEGDEAVQDAVDALQEVCGLEEQTIAYLLRYEYGDELVRKLAAGLR